MKKINTVIITCMLATLTIGCVKPYYNNLPGTPGGAIVKPADGDVLTEGNQAYSMNPDEAGGDDSKPPANPCESVPCTKQFVSLEVKVVDALGNPVKLDSYHTEDMAGNVLPTELYDYNDWGKTYVFMNDMWLRSHQNTTLQVRFVGTKGGKAIDGVFTIHTDCCHVSKTNGPDIIAL